LITESGSKLLSARLPRLPEEIEQIMATHDAPKDTVEGPGHDADQGTGQEIGRTTGHH
jgi:hypothetical protein